MPFSLYIHIPYCLAKCPYCDFNSHAALSWPEAVYTGALITEMRKGSKLEIRAASLKGKASTDSYSLSGFSQAMDRLQKECTPKS